MALGHFLLGLQLILDEELLDLFFLDEGLVRPCQLEDWRLP